MNGVAGGFLFCFVVVKSAQHKTYLCTIFQFPLDDIKYIYNAVQPLLLSISRTFLSFQAETCVIKQ